MTKNARFNKAIRECGRIVVGSRKQKRRIAKYALERAGVKRINRVFSYYWREAYATYYEKSEAIHEAMRSKVRRKFGVAEPVAEAQT